MIYSKAELLRSLKGYKINTIGLGISIFLAMVLGVGISEMMPENIFIFMEVPLLPGIGFAVGIVLVAFRPFFLISKEVAHVNKRFTVSNIYGAAAIFFIFVDLSFGVHLWMTIINARANELIAQSETVSAISSNIKALNEKRKTLISNEYTPQQIKEAFAKKEENKLEIKRLSKNLSSFQSELARCPHNYYKNCIDPLKQKIKFSEDEINRLLDENERQSKIVNYEVDLNQLHTRIESEKKRLVAVKLNGGDENIRPYDDIWYIMSAMTFGLIPPYVCAVIVGLLFMFFLVMSSVFSPILAPLAEEIRKKDDDENSDEGVGVISKVANFFKPNPIEPSPTTATGEVANTTSNWQTGFHDFQPRTDGNANENNDRTDGNPNEEFSFGIIPKVPPKPQKKPVKKLAQKGGMKKFDIDKYNLFVKNYKKFNGVMADLMLEFNIPRTTAYNYRRKAKKEGKIT